MWRHVTRALLVPYSVTLGVVPILLERAGRGLDMEDRADRFCEFVDHLRAEGRIPPLSE